MGPYSQLRKLERRFAQPGIDYTLTQARNTIIACTGCQGSGLNYINVAGHVIKAKCGACGGSKVMSNNQEAGK
jgi:hypothetical protein